MRRSQRLIASAVLIALCGVLAGCSSGLSNWDPSDMLDFLDTKKKLPGKREPVFPEGVPGIEQGVPKELYKSNVEQQQLQQQEQAAAPAVAAPPPEEPKQARRSRAKDKTAGTAPAGAEAAPGGAATAPPARKPKRLVHRRSTSLPKEQPAPQDQTPPPPQQPAQQTQPAASPFPAPLPSGSFSR